MKSWMCQLNHEVLFIKQESHVIAFIKHNLQDRINQACHANGSHCEALSH